MNAQETFYRRYIDALNARTGLEEFVNEELTYNGRALSRLDYEAMITGNFAAIPDLFFRIELLAATDDLVAARLFFDCTPTGEFLGMQVNGRRVAFAEHVFYTLRNGKIHEVHSLIDRSAIANQLGR